MFQGRFQEGFLALGRGRFQMFWEGPNKVTFNRTTNANSFLQGIALAVGFGISPDIIMYFFLSFCFIFFEICF